jgi:hypothetical protein
MQPDVNKIPNMLFVVNAVVVTRRNVGRASKEHRDDYRMFFGGGI